MPLFFFVVVTLLTVDPVCFTGWSRHRDVADVRAGPVGLASPVWSSLHAVVSLVALTRAQVYESLEAYSKINILFDQF